MRWRGGRQSSNIEDRRGMSGRGVGGGIGIGAVVVALVVGWLTGVNPLTILGLLDQGGGSVATHGPAPAPPANDEQAQFVSVVLASTEDVWAARFQQMGSRYQPPRLTLYRDATATACGTGQAAMGPFYCPGDQKVYLDLDFFDTMSSQLGAPGEFAQAYVIGHEVGHHVQNLMGISDKVHNAQQRAGEAEANALSVRLELQADCLAGIWAHDSQQSRQWLEPGDLESGLNAASQIGDDTLQKRSGGRVVPESFTHGSSAQRVEWLQRGAKSGDLDACDTFAAGV